MNKKIKFAITGGIILLLVGLGLFYFSFSRNTKNSTAPNNSIATVSSSTPPQVPTSTSEIFSPPSSTVDIDQDNPATWPRYYFKELGFSIQAPFPSDKTAGVFHDCTQSEDRCDGYENGRDIDSSTENDNMYWFGGKIDTITLSSFSNNYAVGGETGLNTYDFIKEGSNYFIVSSGSRTKWEIHPIKIFSNFETVVVYFDAYQDYVKVKAENLGSPLSQDQYQYYGAVFKLPYSKKFKAVTMMFNEKKMTQDQFISILNTLNFE